MKLILFLTLLFAFTMSTNAQVKTNFNNHEPIDNKGKFIKNYKRKIPFIIPEKDIKVLLDKERQERSDN
ncbi:MAG: hypothetical protein JST29_08975 [Bacteroidetes bacterium]|nr:hypothetical protein [Bacteroidota bacterium]MBS1591611.1 hypothetical protein [Bacteroidota bacterium]